MYKPKTDGHLELAILVVVDLADRNGLVAPPDVVAKYLEKQLHVDPKLVTNKIVEMESKKLIKLMEMKVEPRRVGYDLCEFEKRHVKGYVTTDDGKRELHSYGTITHHAFGKSMFPEFHSGP
ncbi:MAG: hypothetical protein QMD36_02885 [Candidatus Aenigmarchaeota archaeon]|nr:hypothetical protein [Candidatus Aenigmarchaeota archaeon]